MTVQREISHFYEMSQSEQLFGIALLQDRDSFNPLNKKRLYDIMQSWYGL
jgi:hypothetical protein